MKLEAETFYFVRDCDQLTSSEQTEVKQVFANVLSNEGICQRRGATVCNLENFGIICGKKTKRKRRSADGQEYTEERSEVKLGLNLKAPRTLNSTLDTNRICTLLRIRQKSCTVELATKAYKRFLKAALLYGAQQLKKLYQHPDKVRFQAAGRDFEAEDEPLVVGEAFTPCDEGMVPQNDMCGMLLLYTFTSL